MPEEWNAAYFYHFFPKETYTSGSVCPDTVCIVDVNNIAYPSGFVEFESEMPIVGVSEIGNTTYTYSIGFGKSGISYNNYSYSSTGYPYSSETGGYMYIDNHDSICGGYESILPNAVNQLNAVISHVTIFPNPTKSQLSIQSTNAPITQLSIINLLGQTVYTNEYNSQKIQVDISDLPAGVYFVKVNGIDAKKFVKQ